MDIKPLKLQGTCAIQLQPARDERGHFLRSYDETIFLKHGLATAWVQENQSVSTKRGVIRGLHYQRPPHAETKLVRAVRGAVWDVFLDLRLNSQTYGQWDAIELSDQNLTCLYVPKGFAHGYCTLTQKTVMLYKVDACYAPEFEGGIRWDDENLMIPWPVEVPVVSVRDTGLPRFRDFRTPFV